jgi:pimeloyl-ACP methyl ester carboxylesterase
MSESDTQKIQPYNKQNALKVVVPWPAAVLAAIGGWIGYSALCIDHNHELPPALEAERRTFANQGGGILSYYVDRSAPGRPLVLIHSINAAGVAYEMLPLFEHYRAHRPVYAIDLPGFGFSDRSNRVYSPKLYTEAILDLLRTQVRETEPADVIALSLSSEFAALAAQVRPELFHSLTLISPSGLSSRKQKRASQQASAQGTSSLFYRLFSFPLWGQAFYDLIATKPSIQFFLRQSFEGQPDPGLIDYAYATAHRPGARFAPLYFVSGQLFTRDIRETVYEKLGLPVLVVYDYDAFVGFDELTGVLDRCPNWHAARIVPTRGLPHWEKLEDTVAALEKFWRAAK